MPETHPQEPSPTEHARFTSAFRASAKRSVEQDRARRAERPRTRPRPMLLLLFTLFLAACASTELQPSPAFPLIFSTNPPGFQVLAPDGITLQDVADLIPVDPTDPSATIHQRIACMLAIPRDNPQLQLNDAIPEQLPLSRLAKNTMVKLPQECGDPASMEHSMQASAAPGQTTETPEPTPPPTPDPSATPPLPEQTDVVPPELDPRQELARASVTIEGVDASGAVLVRCSGSATDIRRVGDRAIIIFQTAHHCIEPTNTNVSRHIDWNALTGFRVTSPYGPLDSRVNLDTSGQHPPPFHIATLPNKDVALIGFSIPADLESKLGIEPVRVGQWEPNTKDDLYVMINGVAQGPFHLSADLLGLLRAPIETTGFEDGYVILRQDDDAIAGPNDSGGLVAAVQDGHAIDVGLLSAVDREDVPPPRQWAITRVTPQEYEVLANQIVSALAP